MKKKIIALVLCAALTVTIMLAAGCSKDPIEGQGASGQSSNPAALSGTLNLNGSTSMAEISNALGEKFMEKNHRTRPMRSTYCHHHARRRLFKGSN